MDELKRQSPARAVGSLATVMGERLGVVSGVLAPLVTWLFVVSRRNGKETVCLTLSAAPSPGTVQLRSPYG